MPTVRHLTYAESHAQRLDNFLIGLLSGVPKSVVYRVIRRGEVRVNGGRKKAHYRLKLGDKVRVPPIYQNETGPPHIPTNVKDLILRSIVADERDLLVLNKPAGIAVHGGSGITYGVIDVLKRLDLGQSQFHLVHRLDRDTSGCLLVAKSQTSRRELDEQFRKHQIQKTYIGVVAGRWETPPSRIDSPLQRYLLPSGERRVRVAKEGATSLTQIVVLDCVADVTRLKLQPVTGRTHQLRVHVASHGHPILGDKKYAPQNVADKTNRLMLHALEVALPGGRSFTVSTPKDFERTYEELSSEG